MPKDINFQLLSSSISSSLNFIFLIVKLILLQFKSFIYIVFNFDYEFMLLIVFIVNFIFFIFYILAFLKILFDIKVCQYIIQVFVFAFISLQIIQLNNLHHLFLYII